MVQLEIEETADRVRLKAIVTDESGDKWLIELGGSPKDYIRLKLPRRESTKRTLRAVLRDLWKSWFPNDPIVCDSEDELYDVAAGHGFVGHVWRSSIR